MALIPTISTCLTNCNSIVIKDTTGFYNVTTNESGWNDGTTVWRTNADSPYVIKATVEISINGGEAISYNVLTAIQEAIFPEFTLYTYAPTDSNGNTTLVDGYYNIKYIITDSAENVIETDVDIVVFCNVACCVSKLAAKVADELCNNCDSEAYNDFLIADGILQALKATAECQGTQEFYKLLTKLQKLCGQSTTGGCGCGCS
jgi:hypothetical protein